MKTIFITICTALTCAVAAYAQSPVAPAARAAQPQIVKGKDVPVLPVALWVENGKPMMAQGPDAVKTAPKNAVMAKIKIYALGGPSIRQATIQKGTVMPPANNDTLVYVLKGRMKVKLGALEGEVGPGDSFYKLGDQTNIYETLEETVIIETNYTRPTK
jgi:hypothetical protein